MHSAVTKLHWNELVWTQ